MRSEWQQISPRVHTFGNGILETLATKPKFPMPPSSSPRSSPRSRPNNKQILKLITQCESPNQRPPLPNRRIYDEDDLRSSVNRSLEMDFSPDGITIPNHVSEAWYSSSTLNPQLSLTAATRLSLEADRVQDRHDRKCDIYVMAENRRIATLLSTHEEEIADQWKGAQHDEVKLGGGFYTTTDNNDRTTQQSREEVQRMMNRALSRCSVSDNDVSNVITDSSSDDEDEHEHHQHEHEHEHEHAHNQQTLIRRNSMRKKNDFQILIEAIESQSKPNIIRMSLEAAQSSAKAQIQNMMCNS